MSALTKVFVVLHVVVSLLLVAGMVVFVNKVEDFQTLTTQAKADAAFARREKQESEVKSTQVIAEKTQAAIEAMNRAAALVAANQAQLTTISGLNEKLAAADSVKKVDDTRLTTLANAIDEAQKANKALEDVITGLRTRSDDVEKKYTESQVALSDLNNRLDALGRELNYSKEQVAALETENEKLRQQIVNQPVRPAPGAPGPVATGGTPSGAPPAPSTVTIRGVVKSKFQVGEVSYATVSVGSADSVAKGTKFNVTDPTGRQFLGYLTIDSVNPNEASGHLNGPNVDAIGKGSNVVSSWQ